MKSPNGRCSIPATSPTSDFLLAALVPVSARANAVYTYTGNYFTQYFDGTAGLTTDDFVSVSLTLANPLPGNLVAQDLAGYLLAWSTTDGLHPITSDSPQAINCSRITTITTTSSDTPEPATFFALPLGVAAFWIMRKRKARVPAVSR